MYSMYSKVLLLVTVKSDKAYLSVPGDAVTL